MEHDGHEKSGKSGEQGRHARAKSILKFSNGERDVSEACEPTRSPIPICRSLSLSRLDNGLNSPKN